MAFLFHLYRHYQQNPVNNGRMVYAEPTPEQTAEAQRKAQETFEKKDAAEDIGKKEEELVKDDGPIGKLAKSFADKPDLKPRAEALATSLKGRVTAKFDALQKEYADALAQTIAEATAPAAPDLAPVLTRFQERVDAFITELTGSIDTAAEQEAAVKSYEPLEKPARESARPKLIAILKKDPALIQQLKDGFKIDDVDVLFASQPMESALNHMLNNLADATVQAIGRGENVPLNEDEKDFLREIISIASGEKERKETAAKETKLVKGKFPEFESTFGKNAADLLLVMAQRYVITQTAEDGPLTFTEAGVTNAIPITVNTLTDLQQLDKLPGNARQAITTLTTEGAEETAVAQAQEALGTSIKADADAIKQSEQAIAQIEKLVGDSGLLQEMNFQESFQALMQIVAAIKAAFESNPPDFTLLTEMVGDLTAKPPRNPGKTMQMNRKNFEQILGRTSPLPSTSDLLAACAAPQGPEADRLFSETAAKNAGISNDEALAALKSYRSIAKPIITKFMSGKLGTQASISKIEQDVESGQMVATGMVSGKKVQIEFNGTGHDLSATVYPYYNNFSTVNGQRVDNFIPDKREEGLPINNINSLEDFGKNLVAAIKGMPERQNDADKQAAEKARLVGDVKAAIGKIDASNFDKVRGTFQEIATGAGTGKNLESDYREFLKGRRPDTDNLDNCKAFLDRLADTNPEAARDALKKANLFVETPAAPAPAAKPAPTGTTTDAPPADAPGSTTTELAPAGPEAAAPSADAAPDLTAQKLEVRKAWEGIIPTQRWRLIGRALKTAGGEAMFQEFKDKLKAERDKIPAAKWSTKKLDTQLQILADMGVMPDGTKKFETAAAPVPPPAPEPPLPDGTPAPAEGTETVPDPKDVAEAEAAIAKLTAADYRTIYTYFHNKEHSPYRTTLGERPKKELPKLAKDHPEKVMKVLTKLGLLKPGGAAEPATVAAAGADEEDAEPHPAAPESPKPPEPAPPVPAEPAVAEAGVGADRVVAAANAGVIEGAADVPENLWGTNDALAAIGKLAREHFVTISEFFKDDETHKETLGKNPKQFLEQLAVSNPEDVRAILDAFDNFKTPSVPLLPDPEAAPAPTLRPDPVAETPSDLQNGLYTKREKRDARAKEWLTDGNLNQLGRTALAAMNREDQNSARNARQDNLGIDFYVGTGTIKESDLVAYLKKETPATRLITPESGDYTALENALRKGEEAYAAFLKKKQTGGIAVASS